MIEWLTVDVRCSAQAVALQRTYLLEGPEPCSPGSIGSITRFNRPNK
jgi:hypothetical protein